MLRTAGVTSGNAADDGAARNSWLLGHFLPGSEGPRATSDVEVKWAVYQGGEHRAGWGVNERAHTLAILVRGTFRLRFPEREVLLAHEGDYVLWEPGVPHDGLSAIGNRLSVGRRDGETARRQDGKDDESVHRRAKPIADSW